LKKDAQKQWITTAAAFFSAADIRYSLSMKIRFAIFQKFVDDLLPHEYHYLRQVARFEDAENQSLLAQIGEVVLQERQVQFNEAIDKRKYSAMMRWAKERLAKMDVDQHFETLNELHRRLMTDAVRPEDEKQLLAYLKAPQPDFYFSRLYHVLLDFRQFLLIRLRHREHQLVDDFISAHSQQYQYIRQAYAEMHEATGHITRQYSSGGDSPAHLAEQLQKWFEDEQLDGYSRYSALVRLTFLHYNQRQYDKLLPMYAQFDQWLQEGRFYSRRILVNYYGNLLLIYSQLDELGQAARYGRLSLQARTADYIHYLNNLASVLLRQGLAVEALTRMRSAFPELKHTTNFHNRTGFVALFVRCLNDNKKPAEGEQYAENFLAAYKEEVFEYRWHLLFAAYLQSLVLQQKFAKVIKVVRNHKLLQREEAYRLRSSYLPVLRWYYELARYREAQTDLVAFEAAIRASLAQAYFDKHRLKHLLQLSQELMQWEPKVFFSVKSMLA
jgi:hypothetical protein